MRRAVVELELFLDIPDEGDPEQLVADAMQAHRHRQFGNVLREMQYLGHRVLEPWESQTPKFS